MAALSLDKLSSGYFQTGRDGRTLFYPWGALGRGYVVASEKDEARLRRQINIYMGVMLGLLLALGMANRYAMAGVVAVLTVVFYYVWSRYYLTRGLQPTDERMRLREAMTAQAMSYSWAALWALELLFLLFTGMCAFVLVIEPADWLISGAGIAMFAPLAMFMAWMLMLRHEGMAAHPK